ncbi:MAG: ArsI/CadI family heavy metal resistance metalloenzyme [Cyanobacteria bacterium P01_F01_bin.3]
MTILKTHIALKVADLERSVAFYRALFEAQPAKHKPGYAKFDIENPALNLTLNVSSGPSQSENLSHLGIQVDSTEAVLGAIARLKSSGLSPTEEFNTDCCYALQDKAWVSDPDGNRWEIFVVHVADTAPNLNVSEVSDSPQSSHTTQAERSCCVPACCE